MYTEMMGGCRTGKAEQRKGMKYLVWLQHKRGWGFAVDMFKLGDKRDGMARMIPRMFKTDRLAQEFADAMSASPRIKKASVVVMR